MYPVFLRHSTRKFTEKHVPEEAVKDLLNGAMCAPSAGNQRPWHFIVVREKPMLEKLALTSPYSKCVGKAPACLVVLGDLNLEVHKGFWLQDCSAATENILIVAEEKGLGAVWIGVYPLTERVGHIRNLFDLPDHIVPFSLVPFGFPAEKADLKTRFDPNRVHLERWQPA